MTKQKKEVPLTATEKGREWKSVFVYVWKQNRIVDVFRAQCISKFFFGKKRRKIYIRERKKLLFILKNVSQWKHFVESFFAVVRSDVLQN